MAVTFSTKSADEAPASTAAKSARSTPTETLPTDRISFAKQLDLLRIYAAASGASRKVVTLAEVENIIKMKSSTISLANPFFTDVGLVQKSDKGFVPSDSVMNFQRAHQWNPDTASQKLAPVIRSTWFAQRLLPKLSFRAMSEQEAINDLAEACSATPEYQPKLALLLDYMQAAGLIVRESGQIRGTNMEATMSESATATDSVDAELIPAPKATTIATAFSQPAEGTVQFHVSVRVDMAEFAGWKADRIAAFFNGIAQVLAAKGELEKNSTDK